MEPTISKTDFLGIDMGGFSNLETVVLRYIPDSCSFIDRTD